MPLVNIASTGPRPGDMVFQMSGANMGHVEWTDPDQQTPDSYTLFMCIHVPTEIGDPRECHVSCKPFHRIFT